MNNNKLVQQVWEKAQQVDNINPNYLRKDIAGAWIGREAYNTETPYGWRIDHIEPIEMGGKDELDNLQPLHWQNDESKSYDYPKYKTIITSKDNRNIESEKEWEI